MTQVLERPTHTPRAHAHDRPRRRGRGPGVPGGGGGGDGDGGGGGPEPSREPFGDPPDPFARRSRLLLLAALLAGPAGFVAAACAHAVR